MPSGQPWTQSPRPAAARTTCRRWSRTPCAATWRPSGRCRRRSPTRPTPAGRSGGPPTWCSPEATARPIHRADWSYIWRPAAKAAGLPEGFGLRHYFATVLIFGGANVKTVQLAMGHTTPTVTLNTYVGYWPDAVDQTRTLVDSALGCTGVVPTGT
ncbi:tyrosine-type recombinase/integrase [Amycolatopsis eburnea]|uniref:tyrosine-type recombinase/integrase n=1 Tax=Amycolatopsis eburnea TaxID=2267691 RepID=UPI001CDC415C|nr:tyrosine-type recombinase/integrase [Amycolatopsis eburnea]